MNKANSGFSLLELLVTISILAIVAMIGLPSYSDLIQKNRQDSSLKYFLNSIHLARSEAVKRSRQVVMCPSSDGTTCSTSVNWDAGWIIFSDDDKDDVHDADETLIRIETQRDSGHTILGSGDVNDMLRYMPSGASLEAGTFTICDPRGTDEAKAIVINITGRPRISEADSTGSALTCS